MANVTNVLVENINMDKLIDNEIITINNVKELFQEMFKKQQKALLDLFQLTLHRSKNPLMD